MSLNERLAGLVKRMRENALPPHKDCTNGWADELEAILAELVPQPQGVSEEQIKHMVNRFLGWRLPENFNPDGGISFKKTFNENTPWPMKSEPVGTNLFDAGQAEAMVRYMLEGTFALLAQPAPAASEYRSYAIGKDDFEIHPVFLGLLAKAESKGRAEGLEEAARLCRKRAKGWNGMNEVRSDEAIGCAMACESLRDDALAATQPEQKGEGR